MPAAWPEPPVVPAARPEAPAAWPGEPAPSSFEPAGATIWPETPTAPTVPVPGAGEGPAARRPLPAVWLLAGALVLLTALGVAAVIVVPRLLSARNGSQFAAGAGPAPTATVDPALDPALDPGTEPPVTEDATDPTATDTATGEPTTAPPTASGIVAIAPAVTDGRAPDVATMFDTYFGGINSKDYDAVGSVLDPAGSIDPGDAAQMRAVADGTRTTQDSDVTLVLLEDAGVDLLHAEVTFRSTQAAGDGPHGRPDETCTAWDIVYTVSAGDAYRIKKSKATSSPC
jgi:hypothetical protein